MFISQNSLTEYTTYTLLQVPAKYKSFWKLMSAFLPGQLKSRSLWMTVVPVMPSFPQSLPQDLTYLLPDN